MFICDMILRCAGTLQLGLDLNLYRISDASCRICSYKSLINDVSPFHYSLTQITGVPFIYQITNVHSHQNETTIHACCIIEY